jgi:hypothetical protein
MFITLPLERANPLAGLAIGGLFLFLGAMAACTFYLASQWAQGLNLWQTALRLPALMALGVGISVVNSRAVLEAIFGRQSPFVRTPKYHGDTDSEPESGRPPAPQVAAKWCDRTGAGALDGRLHRWICVRLLLGHSTGTIVAMPFLILFACGYLSVALAELEACDAAREAAGDAESQRAVTLTR